MSRCRDILESLGASFSPTDTVSALSLAERQLVEIARAIHANVRILVMDEPTAALSLHEVGASVRADPAVEGARVSPSSMSATEWPRSPASPTASPFCATARSSAPSRERTHPRTYRQDDGRARSRRLLQAGEPERSSTPSDRPFFEVRDIRDGRRVHGCSFALRRGEILGIAGLVGSGRTELARLIFGADPKAGGQIMLDSKPLEIRSPTRRHRFRHRLPDRGPQGSWPVTWTCPFATT